MSTTDTKPTIHTEAGPNPDNINAPGEGERELLRLHPCMARRYPLRTLLIWAVALGGVALVIWSLVADTWVLTRVLGIFLIVWGLIKLTVWYFRLRHTSVAVSDRRLTLTRGYWEAHTTEVLIENITDVYVSRSALNRLFGVGDLVVTTGGENARTIVLLAVKDPEYVANVIRDRETAVRAEDVPDDKLAM